jgi:hypothetical protein
MTRDRFRPYSAEELQALPTIEQRQLGPPLDSYVRQLKREEHGYRYSIVWNIKHSEDVTVVLVEELVHCDWRPILSRSIMETIDPSERAAIEAAERGDYVLALLLLHALVEGLMRADPLLRSRERDAFHGVAVAFRRRLLNRIWDPDDADRIFARLRELNDKRNDVIHVYLWRDGLARTNERLADQFQVWKKTYDEVLLSVFEYLSL